MSVSLPGGAGVGELAGGEAGELDNDAGKAGKAEELGGAACGLELTILCAGELRPADALGAPLPPGPPGSGLKKNPSSPSIRYVCPQQHEVGF